MEDLKQKLLDQLGHSFKDPDVFERALTHASVQGSHSYERLEFLGDRVLGLIVADLLYGRFPEEEEGDLAKRFTQLVSRPMLVVIAKELNLSKVISFAGDHSMADSVLADVCEALIAALYLDGGLQVAKTFLIKHWDKYLNADQKPPEDPKTQLQEWAQATYKEVPDYEVVSTSGPAHAPIFVIKVSISNGQSAEGQGASKRQAEHEAAVSFLNQIF
ncbi:MAG: ribonuclease III [bacterium]|nr:ribonuclease III [bacterium]